jgi:hypothetical protein
MNERDEINEALALVLTLAEQNVVDRLEIPREYRRQMKALKIVRDTFGIVD